MFPKLLLTAALALTSGCSLVLVDGPPDFIPVDQPVPAGACTIDRTMPLVDAVGAAAGVATAVFSSKGDYVRVGAVLGAAFGYSSYSGFRKVSRCRGRMLEPDGSTAPDTTFAWLSRDLTLLPRGSFVPPVGAAAEPPR